MIESQPRPGESDAADGKGPSLEKKGKSTSEKEAKEAEKRAGARDDSEKMLLRWVKLSLALVSTGAAANRALQYLEDTSPGRLDPYSVLRAVAAALVIVGIVAAWAACVEHWRTLRRIERGDPPRAPRLTLGLVVGVAVAVLSVVALVALLTARADGGRPLSSRGPDAAPPAATHMLRL